MDTIGLEDTRIENEDKKILLTIEFSMLEYSSTFSTKAQNIAAVLVLESFTNDTIRLEHTFDKIKKLFK